MANAHTVNMSTFEKAQDDSCTSQVLLNLCGHSYLRWTSFMGLHSRGSVRIVPLCVRFFLTYQAQQIVRCRHYDRALEMSSWDSALRVDAQASELRTGIGRWLRRLNKEGYSDTWITPWCSHEINQQDCSWIFEKEDRRSRISSSADAIAVLNRVRVFSGHDPGKAGTRIQVLPTRTDHRGNE